LNFIFREAIEEDLPDLVRMLADDDLGSQREDVSEPINLRYLSAFKQILEDPNNELIVAEFENEKVGMLQLSFIPYLTHIGSWRCLIEGVRIQRIFRGKGVGTLLFKWAIEQAKKRDCSIIQLTTDKERPDAIKFYESLGFKASHIGFKLKLR